MYAAIGGTLNRTTGWQARATPMVMRWLIQEWIAQWLGLRDRLRTGPGEADSWWLSIRERILRFMVSRYVDEQLVEAEGSPDRAAPGADRPPGEVSCAVPVEPRRTFCRVKAEYRPPRKRDDLAGKLRSVSRINQDKRPRWRWL